MIRNLIREAILNAGLIAPMVRLVLAGVPFNDAIKAGIHHFNENRRTSADLPAWVYPDGDAPIHGAALIDAFIATAEQKEWPWHRPRDTQVVVTGFGLPDVGPTPTFVDAPDASLYLSTYFPGDTSSYVAPERRPAVATLLNKILDLGVAFGFAVDMETGQIRSRSAVSFEGLVHRPTPALLEDLVFQSAGGIVSYYEPIGRVAFEDADPLPTLYAYETARREQYRESA